MPIYFINYFSSNTGDYATVFALLSIVACVRDRFTYTYV